MASIAVLSALSLAVTTVAQKAGTLTSETHPQLSFQKCTTNGCTTQSASVTVDSNWRWTHSTTSSTNCFTGNTWDKTLCPDPVTCATNCAIDGADYPSTYGITSSGNALTLNFVTRGQYSTNIGSRVYLLESDTKYQMFNLKNQEFTFDVDVSNLPCGLNGALYFVAMDEDGGMSKYPGNQAGAKYGTGYCDAQCPHDMKFINGEANVLDWTPSTNDVNSGTGRYGTCCPEMDIWEANSISSAYTAHPCTVTEQTRCSGNDCGDGTNRSGGICDKDGCDYNPYRLGAKKFYGPGKTVNTASKFTVVTQFLTSNNSTSGALNQIRRVYIQNGKEISNSLVNVAGVKAFDSITSDFCTQAKAAFGDTDSFTSKGGFSKMDAALQRGMVLALSLWDDHTADTLWLDSNYPTTASASAPGVARGTCATTSGTPATVESQYASASVVYSNIKVGDIGTTF